MSKRNKLIQRFLSRPKDFTYNELRLMLSYFGYEEEHRGATSGSAVRFYNKHTGNDINIHKPHPDNIVKPYVIREVMQQLYEEGLL